MKPVNVFVLSSLLSRAGNACADYAFIWLGLSLLSASTSGVSTKFLSVIYVGQAIGAIFVAPFLANKFDFCNKRKFSVAIDVAYSLILLTCIVLYQNNALTPIPTLFAVILMGAFSLVHSSSVTMYALSELGKELKSSKLGEKFALLISISYLVGAVVSGIIFKTIGFTGCLWLAIISFIPVTMTYWIYFKDDRSSTEPQRIGSFHYLKIMKSGFKSLTADKHLFYFTAMLALLNIAASVMPTITSLGIDMSFPNRPDVFSLIIGAGIGSGILLLPIVRDIVMKMYLNRVIPYFYVVLTLILVMCFFVSPAWVFALMFAFNCVASVGVNVASGALRTARIPKEQIGKANTAITLLLFLGQMLGGALLVPLAGRLFTKSLYIIAVIFIIASLGSFILIPKKQTLEELT